MEAGLEDEKTRLAPKIEVADHVDRVLVLVGGRFSVVALLATTGVRQRELDLETMPVVRTLVAQQFTPGGKSNSTLTRTILGLLRLRCRKATVRVNNRVRQTAAD